MNQRHVYRLENKVSDNGSMVWLYIDGKEIGPMNNHYIGSKNNTGNTSDWLSGKDFSFGYMGTVVRAINNCSLEYVEVWEEGEEEQLPMSLQYDDHMDITGKKVEIIDAGTPTSYQVGYGVKENTVLDTAVITIEGENLVATGIGTATIKIDNVLYKVTVEAAPISLLLLAGQSNMQGIDGEPDQSVICPDGQVYATYADRYKKTVEDVTKFVPSALRGQYSTYNVTGDTTCLEAYPVNMLTADGNGREGMDSGLAYEWAQQTGEKVWVVNLGYGGSSINGWLEGGEHFKACRELFSACQETLRKEISAGHFTLSHMGYFWCQGCADETQTAKWYADKFQTMHESFKTELAFDHDLDEATADKTMEFAAITPIRSGHQGMGSYRAGVYKDTTNVPYYQSFYDLRFNGPRVAQYWMGNNPELTDIWNVCTIQEAWATLPDGTDGVAEYFQSVYKNGTVDYQVQVQQSVAWYTPKTPAAVHDNIHYNQIGYNEIGRESARNTLIMLGELTAPDTETTVDFLTWDGFTPADTITSGTVGSSSTLVVPVVSPVYKSKEVTYSVTDGLHYDYYDLLTESAFTKGTLNANGAIGSVHVSPRVLTSYTWTFDGENLVSTPMEDNSPNNIVKVAGAVLDGQFSGIRYQADQGIQLLHDQEWALEIQISDWTGTAGSMILSSSDDATTGQPYIYFRPKDSFVGFGYYDGSKYHNHGISLMQYDIRCNEGTHVYRFVNHIADDGSNMVWLHVDDQQVAPLTDLYMNSTFTEKNNSWISGKDFVMPYFGTRFAPISGCVVDSILVMEKDYDPDRHIHKWSDWKLILEAGPKGAGMEERSCDGCGENQTQEVAGVWQTYDLDEHMSEMPENYCCDTNLWAEMEHDAYYYHSGERWDIHSSGKVYSVTIPVNAGDQIYATSFGKYGENGNTIGTGSGIRLTFFDKNGLLKTMDPNKTYEEFCANGGYVIAPEGAVAVNVPMYSNSGDNELYILNRVHVYKHGTCVGCKALRPGPSITKQPTNGEAKLGENYMIEVLAEGENLKYQWYFRNAGSEKWYKSGVRDNTYDDVMTKARAGREVYCVITDADGKKATTDTVKLVRLTTKLEITAQPVDATAVMGEMFCAAVEAQGEGLKYQWYFRNADSDKWYKSGVKDNTYDDIMTKQRKNREIYCVITDEWGNTVTTDTVKLIAAPSVELQILTQTTDVYAAMGENYCVTVEAQGDNIKYQWYFRNEGSDKWYRSGVKDNTYDDVMNRARANREVYCVITDALGNKMTTDIVTLVLEK